MKKGNRRRTIEEIEKIRKFYQAGLSLAEIGRRLHCDRTTCYYWVKKLPNYLPKGLGRLLLKVPKDVSVDKFIAKKEAEEEKEIKFWEAGLCIFCKKPKQESWEKTSYCGLKCYISYYELKHLKQHKLCIY